MKNFSWTFPSSFFDSLVVLKYMFINQFLILYEVNSDKQPCLGCPGIIFLTVVWQKTTPIRRLNKSTFSIFCCFLDSLFNRLKIKMSKYEDMATIQQLYGILEQYVDIHAIWHQMNRTNSIFNRHLICHIVRHHKNLRLSLTIILGYTKMIIQLLWHSAFWKMSFYRFFTVLIITNYSFNRRKRKDENLCLLKLKIECNIILNSKSFSILINRTSISIRMSEWNRNSTFIYFTVDHPSWISQDLTWPYFMNDLVFL